MVKLGEICTINMGQSPESSSYNTIGEGLPFFQGNADFGDVHPTIRIWCSNPIKIAEKDDLLISVRAPIGALNIANEQCCIGRGLAALTNYTKNIYKDYLWFALFSKIDELNSKGTGSTFKAINKKILAETDIPLPYLEIQSKITKRLKWLDTLLSKRKQQLSKLDQLVKSRFVDMFGDIYFNTLSWDERPLEVMADIVSGITKGRKVKNQNLKKVPYMAVSNVKDGYIDWSTVKTIEATDKEINQYRLLQDDVLITEGGDPDKVGRGAIIKNPIKNCIHQNHIFRVRLNTLIILPAFFAEYLQHQKSKRYFLGCAKQTTGIASINMKQLKSLPVLLPPIELQRQFSEFVQQVDTTKSSIKQSLETLETLKKSLMQEYFG